MRVMCRFAYLARVSEDCNFTPESKQMADNYKKIDKDFVLSDSSVNVYDYRLLTSGYRLADFAANPIGYYMHGTTEYPREAGVLVKWEDLRIDGDKILAKPCINLSHPRGQRTVDEIETGFLNAASVGNIVALDISTNPADYLPNQKGPTVPVWFNREASLVDIPGNYNALKQLFDKDNNPINLADYSNNKILNMEQIFFTPANLAAMNLSAAASKADVENAFANLIDKANKHDKAVKDLADMKTAVIEKEVKDLVAEGIKEGKFTVAQGKVIEAQFIGNPTGLKSLIDATPKYNSITGAINNGGDGTAAELKNLMDKSYDELDRSGQLERFKALDLGAFKAKFKNRYGTEYKGK